MSWISKGLGIAVLGAMLAAPSVASAAQVRATIRPRTTFVRPYVRPYNYGYYGYRYDPFWQGYYGPQRYYYVPPAPVTTGEVKIDTHMKDAVVYVDGGYVGPISKFKKFSLKPGSHDIELRDAAGHQFFSERVQVVLDKSIELHPPS